MATCTICTDTFTPLQFAAMNCCKHRFHYECIEQWVEKANTCPICRRRCSQIREFKNRRVSRTKTVHTQNYVVKYDTAFPPLQSIEWGDRVEEEDNYNINEDIDSDGLDVDEWLTQELAQTEANEIRRTTTIPATSGGPATPRVLHMSIQTLDGSSVENANIARATSTTVQTRPRQNPPSSTSSSSSSFSAAHSEKSDSPSATLSSSSASPSSSSEFSPPKNVDDQSDGSDNQASVVVNSRVGYEKDNFIVSDEEEILYEEERDELDKLMAELKQRESSHPHYHGKHRHDEHERTHKKNHRDKQRKLNSSSHSRKKVKK